MASIRLSNAGGGWGSTGTWDGGVIPGSGDDVTADASSGSLTMNASQFAHSFDGSAWTGTLTLSGTHTWTIGGAGTLTTAASFKLGAGVTIAGANTWTLQFDNRSAGITIEVSSGVAYTSGNIWLVVAFGTSAVAGSTYTVDTTSTIKGTTVNLHRGGLTVNSGLILDFTTASTLTYAGTAGTFTLNWSGATIRFGSFVDSVAGGTPTLTDTSTSVFQCATGGGWTFRPSLTLLGALQCTGSPTLSLTSGTAITVRKLVGVGGSGNTWTFQAGITVTISTATGFFANGSTTSDGNLITVQPSAAAASDVTISCASTLVTDYISFVTVNSHIVKGGGAGANHTAGQHSTYTGTQPTGFTWSYSVADAEACKVFDSAQGSNTWVTALAFGNGLASASDWLAVNDLVTVSGITTITGLTNGSSYYVITQAISPSAVAVTLSTTLGGSVVTLGGTDQTGITLMKESPSVITETVPVDNESGACTDADSGKVSVSTFGENESGANTENDASISASPTDNESATGTDADASVTETVPAEGDTGTGTENDASVNATATDNESGTQTEAEAISASPGDAESGSVVDADASVTVSASDGESATGTENDSSVSTTWPSDGDTSTVTEVDAVNAAVVDNDSAANVEDDSSVNVSAADGETAAVAEDDSSVTASFADNDNVVETADDSSVSVFWNQFGDNVFNVEVDGHITASVADDNSATVTDAEAAIPAIATDGDTAVNAEDDSSVAAAVDGADTGTVTDSGASITVAQADDDDASAAEADSNIRLGFTDDETADVAEAEQVSATLGDNNAVTVTDDGNARVTAAFVDNNSAAVVEVDDDKVGHLTFDDETAVCFEDDMGDDGAIAALVADDEPVAMVEDDSSVSAAVFDSTDLAAVVDAAFHTAFPIDNDAAAMVDVDGLIMQPTTDNDSVVETANDGTITVGTNVFDGDDLLCVDDEDLNVFVSLLADADTMVIVDDDAESVLFLHFDPDTGAVVEMELVAKPAKITSATLHAGKSSTATLVRTGGTTATLRTTRSSSAHIVER